MTQKKDEKRDKIYKLIHLNEALKKTSNMPIFLLH